MEDGRIKLFNNNIFTMKDAARAADKNKAHRANRADKKKDAAKELQKEKDRNKKLEARLAADRMPDLVDKRGREDEIDAEQVEIFKPRKRRFGPDDFKATRWGRSPEDAQKRTESGGNPVGEGAKDHLHQNGQPQQTPAGTAH